MEKAGSQGRTYKINYATRLGPGKSGEPYFLGEHGVRVCPLKSRTATVNVVVRYAASCRLHFRAENLVVEVQHGPLARVGYRIEKLPGGLEKIAYKQGTATVRLADWRRAELQVVFWKVVGSRPQQKGVTVTLIP